MFVLKRKSRNHTDQLSGSIFENNYLNIFGLRLPIMDTVHKFIEKLDTEHLEKVRELLIRELMENKLFEKWKMDGYYNLSFDGTGIHSFDYEPFEGCPYKETKNEIKWYVSVLEAKLVFSNGWSLSIDSEWIVNQNGRFNKQDCEQVAFKRLASKVKNTFPRLKILVSADGLYCCKPIFDLIKFYRWKFIFTFKDDALKSLWEQIESKELPKKERVIKKNKSGQWLTEQIAINNELQYGQQKLSFVQYILRVDNEVNRRHVHLTNLNLSLENGFRISAEGRLRWKIENEGFNTQKNHGYGLGNKYARKSFLAIKNYYLLLQIAHLINQLVEKQRCIQTNMTAANRSIKATVEDLIALLKYSDINLMEVHRYYLEQKQIRY